MRKSTQTGLPLNALLATAFGELSREFEAAVLSAARLPVLDMCSNLLWHIDTDGADQRDLPQRAALSTRAIAFLVGQGERWQWLRVEADGARGKRVCLTATGREVSDVARRGLVAAETHWCGEAGAETSGAIRASLESLVSQFDLELPRFPMGYGAADVSATGGSIVSGRGGSFDPDDERRAAATWESKSEGRLYVRGAGQDWRPVPRDPQNSVDALPLTALLSEALMGFTIDYESSGGIPLAFAGNVLRLIADDVVEIHLRPARGKGPRRILPMHSTWANLYRHDYAEIEPDGDDPRHGRLSLTEKGRLVRDTYRTLPTEIENRWEVRYGKATIGSLRQSLESVVATTDGEPLHHILALDVPLNAAQ